MDIHSWHYVAGMVLAAYIAFKVAAAVVRRIIYVIIVFFLYKSGILQAIWAALNV